MLVEVDLPDDPSEPCKVEASLLFGILEHFYPVQFSDELIGMNEEDHGRVYEWCEALFGPSGLEFPVDRDGDPTVGEPTFIRARPWVMYLGTVYCHQGAMAAAFKLRWWPEKTK